MKIIRQFGIIFTICWLGTAAEPLLPFAFPASVLGMILLLLLLLTGVLKTHQVEKGADVLLQNMMLLFVPAGVSILEYYPLIRDKVPQLILIALLTLGITLGATAVTVKGVAALMGRKGAGK